jgi:hypothetical protein
MQIKKSREIVLFEYTDGTNGAWCKGDDRGRYGYYNRTQWIPNPNRPDLLQYTEILEMADYTPGIAQHLESLMLLYILAKDTKDGR